MDMQQALTILVVFLAVVYLVRRSIASLRSAGGGCGSCSGCPSGPGPDRLPARKQIYSLGPRKPSD